jgi:hypothetical protein
MTPEQAFRKWWRVYCVSPAEGYDASEKEDHMQQSFLAGQQYQETNQLMVLADIRKAVGDGEGRLTQEELVKRIEGLVSPWRTIKSAPKDWSNVILFLPDEGGEVLQGYFDADFESWRCTASSNTENGQQCHPTHWMPLPAGPVESVTTEKEEA